MCDENAKGQSLGSVSSWGTTQLTTCSLLRSWTVLDTNLSPDRHQGPLESEEWWLRTLRRCQGRIPVFQLVRNRVLPAPKGWSCTQMTSRIVLWHKYSPPPTTPFGIMIQDTSFSHFMQFSGGILAARLSVTRWRGMFRAAQSGAGSSVVSHHSSTTVGCVLFAVTLLVIEDETLSAMASNSAVLSHVCCSSTK